MWKTDCNNHSNVFNLRVLNLFSPIFSGHHHSFYSVFNVSVALKFLSPLMMTATQLKRPTNVYFCTFEEIKRKLVSIFLSDKLNCWIQFDSILPEYLFTCTVHGGQGPGWQSSVQGCSHTNHEVGFSRVRPHTSPQEWAVSERFHSVCNLFLPQKHIYFSGTFLHSYWHAGQRQ